MSHRAVFAICLIFLLVFAGIPLSGVLFKWAAAYEPAEATVSGPVSAGQPKMYTPGARHIATLDNTEVWRVTTDKECYVIARHLNRIAITPCS